MVDRGRIIHIAIHHRKIMISIYHLIWIIPLSAVAGVLLTVMIVLVDDCLYLANRESDRKDGDGNDNP